jgi:ribosome-binding protein aMBF1 (putative translation factor)
VNRLSCCVRGAAWPVDVQSVRYTGTDIRRAMASETYSRHLIRMARRQAGLTQTELAKRAGTSQAAVSATSPGAALPRSTRW